MKYKIFFDESKKIDCKSEYSYYGAISIEESELARIESQIEQLLDELNKPSELHFVNYKPSEIRKYFQVLDFFLSCSDIKFNIYRLNNKHYFQLGKSLGFAEKDLRKYFYVKIPERLFYGLVRNNQNVDGLEIIMDNSTEYQTLSVYEQISDQMNAHSLYRGKSYHVNSVEGIDSKHSRMVQMLDVILGIVVYLLEADYLESRSNQSISRRDFIYRLLMNEDNLSKFHQMISIFTWNNASFDYLNKLEIATVTSQFLAFCNKREYIDMLPVQKFYIDFQSELEALDELDRGARLKLLKEKLNNPYNKENGKLNNSLVELFLGHLSQLEFKDRNKYLKSEL
ncbi:DUF3800 domain-containing protein [Streptococcus suis]|nr:DUF3800 domain-containing protein [Streptococcus suis]